MRFGGRAGPYPGRRLRRSPFSVEAVRASMGAPALFHPEDRRGRDGEDVQSSLAAGAGAGQLVGASPWRHDRLSGRPPTKALPFSLVGKTKSQGLPQAYEEACDLLGQNPDARQGRQPFKTRRWRRRVMAYEVIKPAGARRGETRSLGQRPPIARQISEQDIQISEGIC